MQQSLPENDAGLLKPRQAAQYLGVSTRWLELRRFRGGGPVFVRLGEPSGRVRYAKSDLVAYVEEHRRTSTSDPGPALRPEARQPVGAS